MAEIAADLILNTKILLRRADFDDACVLAQGEPGYHTTTHELKVGDGSTAWKDLPFANQAQIEALIAAGVQEAKDYADGKVASVDKETGTAITVDNTDPKNPKIGLDINNSGNVVLSQTGAGLSANIDLSGYELTDTTYTFTDGTEDGTFVVTPEGGQAQTVKIGGQTVSDAKAELIGVAEDTKDENTIYGAKAYAKDLVDSLPAQIDYTISCDDEDIAATKDADGNELTPAFKRHVLKQLNGTVCTIDVPRDLVLKQGYVDGATNELVLVLVNDQEIRVDVSHLIEYVTGGATDTITVSVDPTTFEATATINDASIKPAKFHADVDTYVDSRIDDKINELDVQDITGFGAGKTLATLTETDGKISATFQDIAITTEQVTDLSTKYKQVQAAVVDPTAEGTAVSFIDTISQDAQGKITVTKKTVDFSDINTELGNKIESVTIDSPDDYQVQLTVDGVKGEAVEVQGIAALAERIGDIEDSYVSKVTGGTDIVVTPVDGTGEITVAHAEHASGLYQAIGHNTIEDPSFFTGIQLDNGHMDPTKSTVINLRNALDKKTSEDDTTHGNILIDLLKSMTIVLDGGTLKIG